MAKKVQSTILIASFLQSIGSSYPNLREEEILQLGEEILAHLAKKIDNGEQLATIKRNSDGSITLSILDVATKTGSQSVITEKKTQLGDSPATGILPRESKNINEIKKLFVQIYNLIGTKANTSTIIKEDLIAELKEVESEIIDSAIKNEKVDDQFLSRRFRNLARIAPDVLEVITTMMSPVAGINVVAKKIAEKAKVESRMAGDSTTDAPPPESKKKKKHR